MAIGQPYKNPMKRTKTHTTSVSNPFQWVFAISLEINFKAGLATTD
jgi:hypothetical protein